MGAFSLVSVLLLSKINEDDFSGGKKFLLYLAAFVSLFFFCTFRNNGFYALIIATPFYLLLNRKKEFFRKTALFVLVITSVFVYRYVIFDVCHAQKSEAGESLSIPLQQIARVIRDNPDAITDDEYKLLETVFDNPKEIGNLYDPELSDNVKDNFHGQVFRDNPKPYINLWFNLFKRCPATYIDALIAQCYGYWFPDVTCWVTATGMIGNYFKTIYQPLGSTLFSKSVTLMLQGIQVIPGLSVIFSVAFYFWIFAFGIAMLAIKKRIDLLSPYLIIICLWATTLASPVFCEFRYLYGMVVTAPVFLIVCIKANRKAIAS